MDTGNVNFLSLPTDIIRIIFDFVGPFRYCLKWTCKRLYRLKGYTDGMSSDEIYDFMCKNGYRRLLHFSPIPIDNVDMMETLIQSNDVVTLRKLILMGKFPTLIYDSAWLLEAIKIGDLNTIKTLRAFGTRVIIMTEIVWNYIMKRAPDEILKFFIDKEPDYNRDTLIFNTLKYERYPVFEYLFSTVKNSIMTPSDVYGKGYSQSTINYLVKGGYLSLDHYNKYVEDRRKKIDEYLLYYNDID